MSNLKSALTLYSAIGRDGNLRFSFHEFDDERGTKEDKVEKIHPFRIAFVDEGGDLHVSCRGRGHPEEGDVIYLWGITPEGVPQSRPGASQPIARLDYDGDDVGSPQPAHGAMLKWLAEGEPR